MKLQSAMRLWEEEARLFALYGKLLREGATHVISRAYRAAVIRHRLKYIVYWNHQEKALVIQRMVRGLFARRTLRRVRAARLETQRLRHKSAIILQAAARGSLARRELARRRDEKERLASRRRMLKLMIMQRVRPLLMHLRPQVLCTLAGPYVEQNVRRGGVLATVYGALSVPKM